VSAVSKKPAPAALAPFLDTLAEILVAQEARLAETRRALRDAVRSLPDGRRSSTAKGATSGRRPMTPRRLDSAPVPSAGVACGWLAAHAGEKPK
jgi:hypothetical protein